MRARDQVDRLRQQWARELPEQGTEPMAVFGRIHRIANLLRPGIEATFAAHGLDRPGFDILASLRRAGPPFRLTPTDLYTSLMVPSGSLTHRLGRLEAAGFIAREPSSEDGRSRVVVLTARGLETVERAFQEDMAQEAACLNVLSRADREILANLLRKLAGGLESGPGGIGRDPVGR